MDYEENHIDYHDDMDYIEPVIPSEEVPAEDLRSSTLLPVIDGVIIGYIYAMVTDSMPGIVKIGMTLRDVSERLSEANSPDTWRPPTPYRVPFAKRVTDPRAKERTIHKLFDEDRINLRKEFFKTPLEKVKMVFDLCDGEEWNLGNLENKANESESSGEDEAMVTEGGVVTGGGGEGMGPKGNRTKDAMRLCFKDGQRIRHVIGKSGGSGGGDIWYGTYNYYNNKIVREGIQYSSLSTFAKEHHASIGSTCAGGNGWMVCDCELENSHWILANEAFLAATGSSSE